VDIGVHAAASTTRDRHAYDAVLDALGPVCDVIAAYPVSATVGINRFAVDL